MSNWIDEEADKLDAQALKAMEDKDYKPWFNLQKGENNFEIDTNIEPRDFTGKFGMRKVFRIKSNGQEMDLGVNPRSPIYREIIQRLKKGTKKFTIIRSGTGAQTRDELK